MLSLNQIPAYKVLKLIKVELKRLLSSGYVILTILINLLNLLITFRISNVILKHISTEIAPGEAAFWQLLESPSGSSE